MDKKIGHRAIIEVDGFHDAKGWIYRLIREGVVKCGQCDEPATNVFWQDRAEWYCRCEAHREYGDQWTGSTRWNPSSFGLNVLKDAARAWHRTLPEGERANVKIIAFDATDYYALMTKGIDRIRRYLVGSEDVDGHKVYADVYPLTNGEYAYEITGGHLHSHGGFSYSYGVKGAWKTEAIAFEAARFEARKRHLLPQEDNPPEANLPSDDDYAPELPPDMQHDDIPD